MPIRAQIVAATRARLAKEPPPDVNAARRVAASREPHRFEQALRRDGVNVIAEIKAASPSAGTIVENPDVQQIATDYANGGAAAISIVAERDFFGERRRSALRRRRGAGDSRRRGVGARGDCVREGF